MTDEHFRIELGQQLRKLRKEHGYTRAEFAGHIGLDEPALFRIEHGQQRIDTLILQRVSAMLNVSMDTFFMQPTSSSPDNTNDSEMIKMLNWAQTMQRNFEIVEAYGRTWVRG